MFGWFHVSFHYSSGCMNHLRWYQLTIGHDIKTWEKIRDDSCITKVKVRVFTVPSYWTRQIGRWYSVGSENSRHPKNLSKLRSKGPNSHHGKVTEFRKVAGQKKIAKSLGAKCWVKKNVVIYETPSIFFSWMWGFSGVGIGSLWYGCFLKLQHPKNL